MSLLSSSLAKESRCTIRDVRLPRAASTLTIGVAASYMGGRSQCCEHDCDHQRLRLLGGEALKSTQFPERSQASARSLSREGLPIIAHRFSGGTHEFPHDHSPVRGDRNSHRHSSSLGESPESAVPDGTCSLVGIAHPPLKRWAIIGSP